MAFPTVQYTHLSRDLQDDSVGEHWMGYPDDLPDFSRLKPPGNKKPKGINDSYYARRVRGELPEVY